MHHQSLEKLVTTIKDKKQKLDAYRPLPPALVNNLNEWFAIELTYNSIAIEGNTLSKQETALVIEKGITIGGKSLKEHLEATNHAYALEFVQQLAKKPKEHITLADILDIHRLILKSIDDTNAGTWRKVKIAIKGSDYALPDPVKVPELMQDFTNWLHKTNEDPLYVAADAHFKLVAIHPFVDGNGRTARLLMNLLLIQSGYPPAVIDVKNRSAYIKAIAHGEKTGDLTEFYALVFKAVEKSLDIYLDAASKTIT